MGTTLALSLRMNAGTKARKPNLDSLREQARDCRACDLWRRATQTVFGEGPARAQAMLVGEQPGDAEDLQGHPFVGPAGALLDRALVDAGLDRNKLYVTNAVKHFKWEPRGKRRLHKTPAQQEIEACHRWLEEEIAILHPRLIVCLGATAARAVTGRPVKVGDSRGNIVELEAGPALLFTVHPSFVLRVPGDARKHAYDALVADLKVAADYLD
ncbi:MAG TPA: UdgX family uracil-DNA binding protein [Burkholderiales bacterium]|nr:UdgX family uracil-DNA binding protein [Burkholderiales bacterium]